MRLNFFLFIDVQYVAKLSNKHNLTVSLILLQQNQHFLIKTLQPKSFFKLFSETLRHISFIVIIMNPTVYNKGQF